MPIPSKSKENKVPHTCSFTNIFHVQAHSLLWLYPWKDISPQCFGFRFASHFRQSCRLHCISIQQKHIQHLHTCFHACFSLGGKGAKFPCLPLQKCPLKYPNYAAKVEYHNRKFTCGPNGPLQNGISLSVTPWCTSISIASHSI